MIDSDILDHLARLARLTVPQEEKEQLAKDITNIVGFLSTIQNTVLPEGAMKLFMQKNVAREDIVMSVVSVYNLVEAAPLHHDGFVQVPKVIGE